MHTNHHRALKKHHEPTDKRSEQHKARRSGAGTWGRRRPALQPRRCATARPLRASVSKPRGSDRSTAYLRSRGIPRASGQSRDVARGGGVSRVAWTWRSRRARGPRGRRGDGRPPFSLPTRRRPPPTAPGGVTSVPRHGEGEGPQRGAPHDVTEPAERSRLWAVGGVCVTGPRAEAGTGHTLSSLPPTPSPRDTGEGPAR